MTKETDYELSYDHYKSIGFRDSYIIEHDHLHCYYECSGGEGAMYCKEINDQIPDDLRNKNGSYELSHIAYEPMQEALKKAFGNFDKRHGDEPSMLVQDKITDALFLCDELLYSVDVDQKLLVNFMDEIKSLNVKSYDLFERLEDEPFSVAANEIDPIREQVISLLPKLFVYLQDLNIEGARLYFEMKRALIYVDLCIKSLDYIPFENEELDSMSQVLKANGQILSNALKQFEEKGELVDRLEVFKRFEVLANHFQFEQYLFDNTLEDEIG